MQTVRDIIKRLGGTNEVAASLGLAYTVVHSWMRANAVPGWRQPDLLRLAVERGIKLSTADFPSPDERVSRKAKAA